MSSSKPGIIGSFINGVIRTDGEGEVWENIYPGTGLATSHVKGADAKLFDEAICSAQAAFGEWSTTPPTERGRLLLKAADLMEERVHEFAVAECDDTGKPLQEIEGDDVVTAYDCLRYFGGVAPTISGGHYDLGGSFAYTRREPIGVCGGIGPWNYPIQMAAWKAAPALACGNTLVFKPSEETPSSALLLAEVLIEAGVPPGVLNIVQGKGDIGHALATHPHIGKISFTGSVPTGKKVMAAAASTVKKVTMELGGKSPMIVLDDADMDRAVRGAMLANFVAGGENCCNGPRVFVHRSMYEQFVEEVATRTTAIRVGHPRDPNAQVSAQISEGHMAKVLGFIDRAKAAGARCVAGGSSVKIEGFENGFYVAPTVFADCTDDMELVQEEVFGPVMSVLAFDDDDEVVRRANKTPYGLSAGVFTESLTRAHDIIHRLDAGTCWINTFNQAPVTLPFGANKQSGFGRENSLHAIEAYTQIKSVYVEQGALETPFD